MNPQTVSQDIPDKLYFKIGEVCDIVGVQAHVLRYWEAEFPSFHPQKNRAGQRTYRRKDVEMALRIKELVYGEGFTIAGAKRKLAAETRPATTRFKLVPPAAPAPAALAQPSPLSEESLYEPLHETLSETNALLQSDPLALPADAFPQAITVADEDSTRATSARLTTTTTRPPLHRLRVMLEDLLTTLERDVLE